MNIADLLRELRTRGIDLAKHCYRTSQTTARAREAIAEEFGLPRVTAGRWMRMSASFYGPPEDPNERRLCDATNQLSAQLHLSIDHLLAIYTSLRYLSPDAEESREDARAWITVRSGGLTVDELKALANSHIRDLNEGLDIVPAPSRRYFRASRITDARGMRYATVCLPEDTMAHLVRNLHERATTLRKRNQNLTHQQAMADALVEQHHLGTSESPYLQPAVLITMDDLEGRGDGTYATTDGTLVTPSEYAQTKLAPYGLCLVYDDQAQPVDLFRTKRVANDKQRAIISIDQLLCADPSCTHTVATSQIHHIVPWVRGGNTNLDNLVGACATHNARNDDNPDRPPRNGKLERCAHTGQAGWRPPNQDHLRFNRHPIMAKAGRKWALSKIAA
ncbi:HNH endonuclease signature motif containing protein [Corynebacterium atypicum]|uniref:HNH endonuclease signature motif containing protein n=1 Tax=Corynebacterium atypicum TaxID=191610 RepID=UPI00068DF87B|nr:HNH endonuclease signature motif containing protein [Corynebacterium atypicum]